MHMHTHHLVVLGAAHLHLLLRLLLLLLPGSALSLSPAQWRQQSIYQVLTDRFARTDLSTTAACDAAQGIYCGGSWAGLAAKLDYIQGMGFTAVWISPVVAQMAGNTADGESYHGYWAQDIWALNSAFGTSADLAALSTALHDRGMYLMVDVVTNHYAYDGCGTCVDYSIFDPFDSSSYFHPYCPTDYNNQTSVIVCWEGDNIVSLPDLRTEDDDVRAIFNSWITQLVANYSIDGLRVDSAAHIETSFWSGFEAAAGVYMVGEVDDGDPSYTYPYQEYLDGVLDYPSYYWITQAFESTSGSITNLVNGMNTLKSTAIDTSLLGSFLENHDNPRFASYTSDMSLDKNAIAFAMLKDGIPIVYQGQEQHFSGGAVPDNREALWLSGYDTSAELYAWVAALNQLRAWAIARDAGYLTYQAWPIYSDGESVVAMRKGDAGGQVVAVYTNVGGDASAGSPPTASLAASDTGFTPGQTVVDVMSCTSFVADSSSGDLAVSLSGGLPRIFYPAAGLAGSAICPSTTSGNSSGTVAITFDETVTTVYGDTIKISGDAAVLGEWNTADAVALSAADYTSSDPLWFVTVDLAPGSVVQYKFINVDAAGDVTWEADPNHTLTVPSAAATVSAAWQG